MTVPFDKIAELLNSPEVGGINFQYGRAKVTGTGFRRLIPFFRQGHPYRILVTRNPKIIWAGAEAQYTPYSPNDTNINFSLDTDKINVRSNRILETVDGRASFVHECVHALQDLRGSPMSMFISETMAAIATAWYYRFSTERSTELGIYRPDSNPAFAVARELAEAYGSAYFNNTANALEPASLSQTQFWRARTGIRRRGYSIETMGRTFHFDGILGLRISRIHD